MGDYDYARCVLLPPPCGRAIAYEYRVNDRMVRDAALSDAAPHHDGLIEATNKTVIPRRRKAPSQGIVLVHSCKAICDRPAHKGKGTHLLLRLQLAYRFTSTMIG